MTTDEAPPTRFTDRMGRPINSHRKAAQAARTAARAMALPGAVEARQRFVDAGYGPEQVEDMIGLTAKFAGWPRKDRRAMVDAAEVIIAMYRGETDRIAIDVRAGLRVKPFAEDTPD